MVTYSSGEPAVAVFRLEEKSSEEAGVDLYSEMAVSLLGWNTGQTEPKVSCFFSVPPGKC
jgi:hypothetical protein